MSERTVTLYSTEGGSDKVYQIHQVAAPGGGWLVNRANGPRGKALRPGTETPVPVSLEEATSIYDRLLKSKLKKGYHEGEGGAAYADEAFAGRASGHRQQLPTAITPERARELMQDDSFGLQEKANGERRGVHVTPDGQVRGINKLGLYTPIPAHWVDAFGVLAAEGGALIDGEQVGDVLYAFDVLQFNINDFRDMPFDTRAKQLDRMLAHHGDRLAAVLKPLKVYKGAEKAVAARQIEEQNGEGFVFKRLAAPYAAGRSEDALKFKFTDSSTCIVIAKNAQRSVAIGLLDATGAVRSVGNATIPANHALPEPGDLVEIQYLYYNPLGAFEQPVYLGARGDVLREECHFGQITRLKPGVELPEELWANGAGDAEDAARETMRA